MLLSKLFLRALKQHSGHIFNINSISGIQPALFGATYGASKAGLRHFGTSLFKEARKSGLKVININPDITNTPFFDDLHFEPTKDAQTYIEPKDIADIIENVLNQREGTIMTDITVEPQKFQIAKKK
jgi:short-subunit dehydrogenase